MAEGWPSGENADEALERLVKEYQGTLLRFCYAELHDAALAEDAVQETFLKVYREVLLCRQLPADADDTERYTPESLQENIPASITEGEEESRRQDEAFRGNADQVAENKALYGPNEAFWPAEVQAATFPAQYSVPTAEDRACVIEIAEAAVVKKFGADALDNLGEYQTGMVFKKDILDEDGDYAIYATVYFTTDPDYLSDGYRIYCFIDNGIIRETDTDLANEGFG